MRLASLILLFAAALSAQNVIRRGAGIAAGGGAATFTHIQGARGSTVSSGTTATVTLGAAPTTGNAVLCTVSAYPHGLGITTLKDSNNNSYTVSASSPSASNPSATEISLGYLLSAPANATAVITVTMGGTITFSTNIECDEFHKSSGSPLFDTDAAGTGSSGTTINTPAITPSITGALLYTGAYGNQAINSVNSPWTATTGGTGGNQAAGYILSGGAGATATAMTMAGSGVWNSMTMSVK